MIATANLLEVNDLINTSHKDPHHVLGMHEVQYKKKQALAVRAFIPQAASILVLDPKDEKYSLEMKKIHVDGFFEAIITDRKEWFRYQLKITGYYGEEWTIYDPYSFTPTLAELDLYLYGEGTHYEIYNKLGAHLCQVDDIDGVAFAVWAPNAKRVSVIGSFNQWDGRRHAMRAIGNSGIWEIFIPGLQPLDHYKFEIKTQSNEIIEKSDPYGNFFELRPSSSALVYDINKYKWQDQSWQEKRKKEKVLDIPMNIYEVHLGSWKRKIEEDNRFLSYVELADELIPYVKQMHYNYIELMPVEEFPFDGSWGYQVTGYYAPTSRYGNPEEFMAFVDKCHQNGIGVILDWVPAHFPKDAHGLYRFDGTALYEHMDPRQGEHPEWGTCIFNYGRKEVKNFLLANALFWIEKYHLDGLRVDAVASMLYLDYGKNEGEWVPNRYGGNENLEAVEFMRHMNSVILGRYPHVFMIAEESTSWAGVSHQAEFGGLGFNLKWNMGWMNDFLFYIAKDPIYKKYHHHNVTFSMVYAYTENFVLVLSHDEVVHQKGSMINKMPGDYWQKFANLRLSYGFMYGHPGKKLLFMGGEFAQFAEWSESRSLDWHLLDYELHKKMQDYVRDINRLYLSEKALWALDFQPEGFEWISCNDSKRSILAFVRKTDNPEDTLIIVCNFTPTVYMDHRIGVPLKGQYREIMNSDASKYGGSGIENPQLRETEQMEWDGKEYSFGFSLPPLATVIFKWIA